jgi:hypothetical protein
VVSILYTLSTLILSGLFRHYPFNNVRIPLNSPGHSAVNPTSVQVGSLGIVRLFLSLQQVPAHAEIETSTCGAATYRASGLSVGVVTVVLSKAAADFSAFFDRATKNATIARAASAASPNPSTSAPYGGTEPPLAGAGAATLAGLAEAEAEAAGDSAGDSLGASLGLAEGVADGVFEGAAAPLAVGTTVPLGPLVGAGAGTRVGAGVTGAGVTGLGVGAGVTGAGVTGTGVGSGAKVTVQAEVAQ